MNEFIEMFIAGEGTLLWLGSFSMLSFFITMSAVPVFIIHLPPDYFVESRKRRLLWADKHPLVRAVLITGKNISGIITIIIGFILLFLPGQGVLTMLAGIMLTDLPGKYRLERFLAARPAVIQSINWVRRQAGKEPVHTENLPFDH